MASKLPDQKVYLKLKEQKDLEAISKNLGRGEEGLQKF